MYAKMQRRSSELHLAVQEYLDVDWTHVRCYLKRQITKCVNECKSQASNAKRIVGTMKHRHRNKSSKDTNGEYEYDSEDFDDWDSDFDDEFDDEYDDETSEPAVLQSYNTCKYSTDTSTLPSVADNGKCDVKETITKLTECSMESVPKSQTLPSNANSKGSAKVYPRPPIKRPPSQPPPPPVPRLTSQDDLEEYEIPISHQNNSDLLLMRKFSLQEYPSKYMPKDLETYEFIQPSDDSYRVSENPPVLLPRNSISSMGSPPPPLPMKPDKLKTSPLNSDTFRSISRPKLPTVDDSSSEGSGSLAILGSTIMNSILGRRSSTPSSSPKMHRSVRDLSGNFSSAESQSSRSSSPDKDGMFTVGSSAFITSASSSWSSDTKSPCISQKSNKIEDIAQNMASRPLPPVPTVEVKSLENKDLCLYPWFHEVERSDAEDLIKNIGMSGAFLVRPSKRAGKDNPYTVTVLYEGKIFHLNVRLRPDKTYALGKEKIKEKTFLTVADLINHHRKENILLTSRGESAGQTILLTFPEK